MSFDAERLISEIESRKAMWNISREDYTNQEIKKKQRKKIVNVFVTEKTSAEEKKDFGLNFRKRWKNLRSRFS